MKRVKKTLFIYLGINIIFLIIVGVVIVRSVQLNKETNGSIEAKNILDIVSSDPQLSAFAEAGKEAGLSDSLKGDGPYTVFVPTNEAFDKIPEETRTVLFKPSNKELLVDILYYHIYPNKLLNKDIVKMAGNEITMLNSKNAVLFFKDQTLCINNAKVIKKDIKATNGIIHVIDTVLVPKQ